VDIKTTVLDHPLLKGILEQITDPLEREKTIKVIEGMLEQMQGKANGLVKACSKKP
jgi:hypothetical protein